MDTQVDFDPETSMEDFTSMFSLSVVLSSIQIFNMSKNIQDDGLSHSDHDIQFYRSVWSQNFPENEQGDVKPFQDLKFLVWDCAYLDDGLYGWGRGQNVLNEELEKGEQASTLAKVKDCFDSLECFLMPHPGDRVDSSFDSRREDSDIDPKIVESMKSFVEEILRPSNLKPERINGRELTVRELFFDIVLLLASEEFQSLIVAAEKELLEQASFEQVA